MADQVLPGTSGTSNVSPLNRAAGVTSQVPTSLLGFNAHFHPVRLKSRLETLGGPRHGNPRIPVKLVGGILNFCDPTTFSKPSFSAVLEEDRSSSWKITAGINPKHAFRYTEQDWQAMLRHSTHSRVIGISEVGLDFSVPSRHWGRQEVLFERILDLGTMGHVLVIICTCEGEKITPKVASYIGTRFVSWGKSVSPLKGSTSTASPGTMSLWRHGLRHFQYILCVKILWS